MTKPKRNKLIAFIVLNWLLFYYTASILIGFRLPVLLNFWGCFLIGALSAFFMIICAGAMETKHVLIYFSVIIFFFIQCPYKDASDKMDCKHPPGYHSGQNFTDEELEEYYKETKELKEKLYREKKQRKREEHAQNCEYHRK